MYCFFSEIAIGFYNSTINQFGNVPQGVGFDIV